MQKCGNRCCLRILTIYEVMNWDFVEWHFHPMRFQPLKLFKLFLKNYKDVHKIYQWMR